MNKCTITNNSCNFADKKGNCTQPSIAGDLQCRNIKEKTLWEKLDVLHAELQDNYYNFSKKKMKGLEDSYNIDCGLDYADHIFAIADLLNFYNGNG